MSIYKEALSIKDSIVSNRRYLHRNPELGLDLPVTAAFVEEKLKEMGYKPQRMGHCGIVATIGKEGGKCILLRADMDALPVKEETDVECKSTNGNMHACGHDCHTACLLGAAQLLKNHEAELEGKVKLMLQPAEETVDGAKMMIAGGILDDVDAAMGIHVFTAMPMPAGTVVMMDKQGKMAGSDWFTIKVTGKGCHGASPNTGVDPLNVLTCIYLALQTINSRELDPADNLILTVGQMHGGSTSNVIPSEAYMTGTIRTLKNETRAMVKQRVCDIVSTIASAFRAKAVVEYGNGCPVLTHDKTVYSAVKSYLKELDGVHLLDMDDSGNPMIAMASEDFACVSSEVPCIFLILSAGTAEDGYCYPQHHPKATFDETALPVGSATYAHVAVQWLKEHK